MRISFISSSNTKLSEHDKNYTWQTGEFSMRPVRNSSTARQKKFFGAKKTSNFVCILLINSALKIGGDNTLIV